MTELEKHILGALADFAICSCEIGKTQTKLANYIAGHLPAVSEDERQEFMGYVSASWKQQQTLQESARKLKKALRG